MPIPPIEASISGRARAIAGGLVRTQHAKRNGAVDRGMLRYECKSGGFYWISLDGNRVLRGTTLSSAEELQPKFIDAMERAGR
jgi:hypothetical protein